MTSLSYISSMLAALALGSVGITTFVDIADGPGSERQERVANTPAIPKSLSDLKSFIGKTRYYVGERYGFKEDFIAWNGAVKLAVFGHSPANNVAVGQDGFLFLTTQGAVEIAQGQDRLTPPETADWETTFRTLRDDLEDIGAKYSLLIGPNKHTIYPEKLPSWITPAPRRETRTQDILHAARSVFGETFPDGRQILADARGNMADVDLYHPTDTHWTELGAALVVYEALQNLGIDAEPPEYSMVDLPHSGDLSRMIGQQTRWSASAPELPRTWQCHNASGNVMDVVTIDPLMPRRFSCGSPNGRDAKVVVFHDSFGVSAIPYIAAQFRHVDFIWTNAAEPATAAELGAQYVFHIIVERRFGSDTPERLLLKSVTK